MRRACVGGASFLWFLLPSALSPLLSNFPSGTFSPCACHTTLPYTTMSWTRCEWCCCPTVVGGTEDWGGYIYGFRGVLKQPFHIAVRYCICHLSALVDTSSVGPRYTTISWTRCERCYCPTGFGGPPDGTGYCLRIMTQVFLKQPFSFRRSLHTAHATRSALLDEENGLSGICVWSFLSWLDGDAGRFGARG